MSVPSPDRGVGFGASGRLPSAAPTVLSTDVARYWQKSFQNMERQAFKWALRLKNGKRPLTPGEAAQLRSLITALKALGADEAVAQMGAAVQSQFVQAARASMMEALGYIPEWAQASALNAAESLGWSNVPNTPAVSAAASGQIGWVTSDFQNLTAQARQFLVGELAGAVAAGDSPRELAKRISKVVDTTARRGQARSVMIARTSLARVYDLSSQEVYKQGAELGVLQGWRWVASAGACPVCAALNGMVFPVDADTYRHPNCRCTMTPVTKHSDAYGTPFGDRFDPFPDTEGLVDKLEIVKSPSGWWNWRLHPKTVRVQRKTMSLREVVRAEPKQPVAPPKIRKPAAKVKPTDTVQSAPEPPKAGLREMDVPTSIPAGMTREEFFKDFPWLEPEMKVGDSWLLDMNIARRLRDNRYFYDEANDIMVIVPKSAKVAKANLDKYLQGVPEAVARGRVNMPLRYGESKVRRTVLSFDGRAKGRTNAMTFTNGNEIHVNRNQFSLMNSKTKTAAAREDGGLVPYWSVSSRVDKAADGAFRTIVHEMGHNADRTPPGGFMSGGRDPSKFIWTRKRDDLFAKWRTDALTDEQRAVVLRSRSIMTSDDVAVLKTINDGPTVYGRSSAAEMFAEAYATWAYRDVIDMGPRMRAWVEDFAREFGWV